MDRALEMMTTGQAAKLCGVSVRTIINWINQGKLKSHKLPGNRGDNRILYSDLYAFLKVTNLPIPEELEPKKDIAVVVDDDEGMARGIARQLKSLGYVTGLAHNGFDAGIAYATLKPTLLTLDLQMPRMDGFQLLRQLKSRETCKIMVISGMAPEALDKALRLGADAVLPKPYDHEAFAAAVRSLYKDDTSKHST